MSVPPSPRRAPRATRLLVEHGFQLARELGIKTLLVEADLLRDVRVVQRLRDEERVVWLVRASRMSAIEVTSGDGLIGMPEIALTRISRTHLGLFLAVIQGKVDLEERVVLLTGSLGARRLDTVSVAEPAEDLRWLGVDSLSSSGESMRRQTLARTVDVALRLASEGREGRPIGTAFVIGELAELEKHLRQLILNPLRGHPRRARDLNNPEFIETLRELAALDGAFVLSPRGVVESAGTYLDARTQDVVLKPGGGSRHAAAAAITMAAPVVAVTLSESSGAVTVYEGGRAVLELERVALSTQKSESE